MAQTQSTTPPSRPTPDMGMGLIGFLIAAGTLLLLLPLLTFLAAVWLLDRLRSPPA
ncbi:MAG: hypothetical protein ABEH86_04840 [Haloarcula sp.]